MEVVSFNDPDGMRIELIASDEGSSVGYWDHGPVPRDYALRGFHGVTLWLDEIEPTADLLVNQMGYALAD